MGHSSRWVWVTAAMLTGLAGCQHLPRTQFPATPQFEPPVVSRGSVGAAIKTLPQLPTVDGVVTPEPLPSLPYRALTAAQCQCLAAAAATPAQMHDEESGLVRSPRLRIGA